MSGFERQLAGLVLLRATLVKNQLFRPGRRLGGAFAVLVLLAILALGVGAFFGSWFLGLEVARESPQHLGYVWHGVMLFFAFFWGIGLLTDLQRAEALDIRRLLHLPISLDRVFVLNFVSSLACPSVAILGPAFLGLALGTAVARGPLELLVLPVCAGVVLAIAAASYALSGWLAALMENKRARRTVLTLVPLAIVVVAQLPQLWVRWAHIDEGDRVVSSDPKEQERARARRRAEREARYEQLENALDVASNVLPPLWPGVAARGLHEGRLSISLLATAGSLGLAALFLLRALRTARRHYTDGGSEAPAPRPVAAPAAPRTGGLLELTIRGIPDDVTAMAAASLRMLVREPMFRMSLLMLPILLLVFAGAFGRGGATLEWQRPFAPIMAAALSLLIIHKHTSNAFGTDRDGFRQLVLLPTPRVRLLLGRNLALLPVTLAIGVPTLALIAVLRRLGPGQCVTGVLGILLVHTVSCTVGNFLSILNPFRFSVDMTARQRQQPSLLGVLELLLALPLVSLPLALPGLAELAQGTLHVFEGVPVGPLVALLLLLLAVAGYAALLPAAGALLERREKQVLERLTRIAE
ncbi:MAG TPA: hypothetical protein VFF73_15695 [Planctomycetota bacterium]|nr:hypothetical protein [Planctomycetota bacterium]